MKARSHLRAFPVTLVTETGHLSEPVLRIMFAQTKNVATLKKHLSRKTRFADREAVFWRNGARPPAP